MSVGRQICIHQMLRESLRFWARSELFGEKPVVTVSVDCEQKSSVVMVREETQEIAAGLELTSCSRGSRPLKLLGLS
jgi:hypothetical protein